MNLALLLLLFLKSASPRSTLFNTAVHTLYHSKDCISNCLVLDPFILLKLERVLNSLALCGLWHKYLPYEEGKWGHLKIPRINSFQVSDKPILC